MRFIAFKSLLSMIASFMKLWIKMSDRVARYLALEHVSSRQPLFGDFEVDDRQVLVRAGPVLTAGAVLELPKPSELDGHVRGLHDLAEQGLVLQEDFISLGLKLGSGEREHGECDVEQVRVVVRHEVPLSLVETLEDALL